jgi:Protein of unknown function (DUF2846)
MKSWAGFLAVVALSGCVSAPKAAPDAEAAAKKFTTVPGEAQLYIVRPSSYGLAVMYQVSIDGRIVGSLPAETFLLERVGPGNHQVSFLNNTSQENTNVSVEAGKNYYLRVGMNPAATSNRARIKLVPDEEGQKLVLSNTMVQSLPLPQ